MINKIITFTGCVVFLTFVTSNAFVQEQNTQSSDQQINDFSLAGFGQRGKKTWDISGKSADIFTDVVKLKDITGNLYGEQEQIKLTAERGDFNKAEGKVHLEENVVVTTSSGAKLTTDTLDWDRKKQIVTTQDEVNIEKENMVTNAVGAVAQPNLNKVTLQKDVTVKINPAANESQTAALAGNKIIITCAGPMAIDYEKNIATFNNNVKVDRADSQIYSDILEVYFNASDKKDASETKQDSMITGSKIEKIVARGNVKIIRGENISYSQEAVYEALTKKITLSGAPKLIIYSTEDLQNASAGN